MNADITLNNRTPSSKSIAPPATVVEIPTVAEFKPVAEERETCPQHVQRHAFQEDNTAASHFGTGAYLIIGALSHDLDQDR
jgi:hypothetical protein